VWESALTETEGPPRDGVASLVRLQSLYRSEAIAMVRLAFLLVGSLEVAEDLVHDAFVQVAPRLERADNPGAYLRTAVVNACRGWQRRQATERRHPSDEWRPALPPELDETWGHVQVLPPRQRMAVVLRFYEDLTYVRIAELMGCRVGTAKATVHRAVATLRTRLGSADD
jgi:DNA-directed RNA polymerase specialized sigma24 family protein